MEASALCRQRTGGACRRQKGGIVRRLKRRIQAGDVLLFTDWTLLRLFPPLRAMWAAIGTQAAELHRQRNDVPQEVKAYTDTATGSHFTGVVRSECNPTLT